MDKSGHRASRSARHGRDWRGQTETIGVVLMLALVVASTTLVVAYGSTAINGAESQAQIERAGHSMTLFDANAATVALGDSRVRSVDFGGYGGSYNVDPNEGHITIKHIEYDGTNNSTIFDDTLGTVSYRDGDEKIAYQGGGVWRQGATGGSTMLSPPEFHYRGSTLTLPVIRVTSGTPGSGAPTAVIQRNMSGLSVFPNESAAYPTSEQYVNPTEEGEIHVTIQSAYYKAWGSFFDSRTEGEVRYDDDNETVTIELVATGDRGGFIMPGDGGSISIRGLEGNHSLQDFSIIVRPDDTDSSNFANLQWSMYVEDGDQQLELHLRNSGGKDDCEDARASLTLYYSETGGDTYHGWQSEEAYSGACDGDGNMYLEAIFSDDDDSDGEFDDVDYETDPSLTYTELQRNDLVHFNPGGGELVTTAKFDEHGWDQNYTAGDTETVDRLLNHYFALMGPTIELTVDDQNSDTVNEAASSGTVEYVGTGKYITFLHVTENGIDVRFE